MSDSLRSLMINERMSDSLKFFLAKIFFDLKNEQFAHSLFFNEQCERIAQVAHQNERP